LQFLDQLYKLENVTSLKIMATLPLRYLLLAAMALLTFVSCNAYPTPPTSNVERVERQAPVTDAPYVPDNTSWGAYSGRRRYWY
jgi:hypothetical protein